MSPTNLHYGIKGRMLHPVILPPCSSATRPGQEVVCAGGRGAELPACRALSSAARPRCTRKHCWAHGGCAHGRCAWGGQWRGTLGHGTPGHVAPGHGTLGHGMLQSRALPACTQQLFHSTESNAFDARCLCSAQMGHSVRLSRRTAPCRHVFAL